MKLNETNEPSIYYMPFAMAGHRPLMLFHQHLLADTVRTESFLKAIEQVVKPGDVAVDLGSGTGILAMACRRAGAKTTYAVEVDRIILTAAQVAQANGIEDGIEFICKNSFQTTLPEKADVIVSECLGFLALGGDMVPAVIDMRKRFLKEGGTVIPNHISAYMAPIDSQLHYDYVHTWEQKQYYGLDFSLFQKIASNNLYIATASPESLLAEPQKVINVNLMTDDVISQIDVTLRFVALREGCLHGFCGWFDVDVCDGVSFSTAPGHKSTVWQQLFFPLEREIPIKPGAIIELDFGAHFGSVPGDPVPPHFRWHTGVIYPDNGYRPAFFKQSTLKSFQHTSK